MLSFCFYGARTEIADIIAADLSQACDEYWKFRPDPKDQFNIVKIAKVRLEGNKQGALQTWDVFGASVCHSSDGGAQRAAPNSLG